MQNAMLTNAVVTMLGLYLAGCASGGTPNPTPQPESAAVVAPLAGENFVVYYNDGIGLRLRDTRSGSDAVLLPRSPVITNGEAGFGMGLAAFAQRSGDSTWLRILVHGTNAPATVHRGGVGRYSYAWSRDRRQLAFGFEPASRSGGAAGIWVVSGDGEVRSVGCRMATGVHAWRSNRELLVSDARNVYAVNAETCATLATLPKQGKQNFAFASGGERLSFSRGPELYVANYNGSGSQKISDPQVAARDANWAADGSKVAFVINSPRFANRTHVAVHDVATGRISYSDRESPLGVPNESNPCWSPDGRRLLFDRVFDRSDGAQTYQTHQRVVKRDNTETVVFEELVRDGRRASNTACTWVDDGHILISTNSDYRVINVDDRSEYAIGDAESVLMVRVYE